MSNLSPSLLVPNAPQVNLIPPEVASRKAAGRLRGVILAGFLVFLLLLGAATFLADARKRSAEAALQLELDRGAALQADVAKYAEVPVVKNQTANAESAAQYAGATEIRWLDFFSLVAEGIPAGITLENWTLGVDPAEGEPTADVDPFASDDIGVLAFTGSSATYPDLAALERSLDSVDGFHNTSIPAATRSEVNGKVSYTFDGTTQVTAEALTQRFTEGAALKLMRTRALIDLVEREADAATAVSAAEAALAALEEGASQSYATALAALATASEERQDFFDLLEAYTSTQAALAEAQAAVEAGASEEDADLPAVQTAADAVAASMDNLSAAIMQRAKAQKALDQVERRILAAEALVAAKEEALATAQAIANEAAATGTPVSPSGVAYATQLVSEAKDVLTKEKGPLAGAEGVVGEAQDAVDDALAAVPAALEAARTLEGEQR